MVICRERGADLHTAQLMPLPLTVSCFSKIQILFFPFWYRFTRVVRDKGPSNDCVCDCTASEMTYIVSSGALNSTPTNQPSVIGCGCLLD